MALLKSQFTRKFILSAILAWGVFTYAQNASNDFLLYTMMVISVFGLFVIWRELSPIFTLILLSFTSGHALYSVLYQMSLPLWFAMIGTLIIFSYLFIYVEQKIGILGNKRLIYLVLFSLIILEVFLILSYFLIDPTSQGLIIAAVSYLFVGFCYTILAKHTDNKFFTYVTITSLAIAIVFVTSNWGGLV
jgi:hypothetical protein